MSHPHPYPHPNPSPDPNLNPNQVEDQSVLAEERRELSEQMRAWAGQPDTGPT